MNKQNSVLLVSPNPDLHRTLELVATTCNSRFFGAENAKKAVSLIISGEADCIIFDLATLPNAKHKEAIKKRVEKSGVPTLWLNDGMNGTGKVSNGQKLEPLVKFIRDNCDRNGRSSNGRLMHRFLSLIRLRRN